MNLEPFLTGLRNERDKLDRAIEALEDLQNVPVVKALEICGTIERKPTRPAVRIPLPRDEKPTNKTRSSVLECSVCHRTDFVTRGALGQHTRYCKTTIVVGESRQVIPSSIPTGGSIKCNQCDSHCNNGAELIAHKRSAHSIKASELPL